jgi:hypothetical protein
MGTYYYLCNETKKQIYHLDNYIKYSPVRYNEAVHFAFVNCMFVNQGDVFRIASDDEWVVEKYEKIDLSEYTGFDDDTKKMIIIMLDKINILHIAYKESGRGGSYEH